MNLSEIQPVQNESCIFLDSGCILVIADLHIGIESALLGQGLNVPSQTSVMTERIISLYKKFGPKEIIMLGDIKHNIPSSTYHERKDVKEFLDTIQKHCIIHIIPGNHDGNINRFSSENMIIHSSSGYVLENVGFVHGHRWPSEEIMKCEQILMAHTHPTIMLSDRLGYKNFEPCWIKARFKKKKLMEKYPDSVNPEVLIVPAFNPLCGGISVNDEGIMGPIGKLIDIKNAQVFLLDGTLLGKIKDIK
jgi:putative SbcD/Mre11-related phosphoesterase